MSNQASARPDEDARKRYERIGLLVGWVVGMLWWVGLMLYFGPGVAVTTRNGITTEERGSVLGRSLLALLLAVPWALIGGSIGFVSGYRRRRCWIAGTTGALLGEIAAVIVCGIDGWLIVEMPAFAFVGMVAAMIWHHIAYSKAC